MKTMTTAFCTTVLLATASMITIAAAESTGDRAELDAVKTAKVTLLDAIRTAETEAKGKALDGQVGEEQGPPSYEIEVLAQNNLVSKVYVDMQTGKVLKVVDATDKESDGEDSYDQQNDGEQDDDGDQ